MSALSPITESSVTVSHANGEWWVSVHSQGELLTRSFLLEKSAAAFAEGQKARLGLAQIIRT